MLFPCQKPLKNRNCLNFLMFLQGVTDDSTDDREMIASNENSLSESYYCRIIQGQMTRNIKHIDNILNDMTVISQSQSFFHFHLNSKCWPFARSSCIPGEFSTFYQ